MRYRMFVNVSDELRRALLITPNNIHQIALDRRALMANGDAVNQTP